MRRLTVLLIGLTVLTSCSNEPSIQKYFVEKTEDARFLAVDIPPSSLLEIKENELSEYQKHAFHSFEKLNILAFKKDTANGKIYNEEVNKVRQILKTERYEQLMKFNFGGEGASVYVTENGDTIDEFIIFATKSDMGFFVARVLGDKMTPTDIMNFVGVLQKSDFKSESLQPFLETFK